MFRLTLITIMFASCTSFARGDGPLFAYEGDILPYPDAGWRWGGCISPCDENLQDGYFVLEWSQGGPGTNYDLTISRIKEPEPPSLWVEWRFRSNELMPLTGYGCDAHFTIDYLNVHEVVYLHADAVVTASGAHWVGGLDVEEFHTYRFESPDGTHFRFSVDGLVFHENDDNHDGNSAYIQFGGESGCEGGFPKINEWDFIRYGTIAHGEQIVSSDPPQGFIDARLHPARDRFTVIYDSPNYVYIDEITAEVVAGRGAQGTEPPVVIATRRLDNGPPDTVEVVLDRPIPYNATTSFAFKETTIAQFIEFTYAPGDVTGDGHATLADFAYFQNCFQAPEGLSLCAIFDRNENGVIDLADFAAFHSQLP